MAEAVRGRTMQPPPKEGAAQRVDLVQIDGLTLMKILKHARENPHESASGPLLGLVQSHTLEITNCFPTPPAATTAAGEDDDGAAHFQLEMLKCLREVNVDHLQVGWYQTTVLGAHLTLDTIQRQFEYQKRSEESVVLIYDPVLTTQGSLSLRAYRLTTAFMSLYRGQEFSPASLRAAGVSFDSVFTEVPVLIRTSHLARALVYEIDSTTDRLQSFEQLDISSNSFLERNVKCLMDCVDHLGNETNKYQFYQRNVQRQQMDQSKVLQRRQAENREREQQGLEPLGNEDLSPERNPLFKPLTQPSRLESLLITGQINHYCGQISTFANSNYGKLFLAQGLQTPG